MQLLRALCIAAPLAFFLACARPSSPSPNAASSAALPPGGLPGCVDVASCRAACDHAKDASACRELGLLHQKGMAGAPFDPIEAMRLYVHACSMGYAGACTDVGYLHERGIGTPADHVQAAQWFSRGCSASDGLGCYNLGILYDRGGSVPTEPERATAYFARACELRVRLGCASYGFALTEGRGAPRDVSRGMMLLDQSCKGGDHWACDKIDRIRGGM